LYGDFEDDWRAAAEREGIIVLGTPSSSPAADDMLKTKRCGEAINEFAENRMLLYGAFWHLFLSGRCGLVALGGNCSGSEQWL
jgi:hypothetical protein